MRKAPDYQTAEAVIPVTVPDIQQNLHTETFELMCLAVLAGGGGGCEKVDTGLEAAAARRGLVSIFMSRLAPILPLRPVLTSFGAPAQQQPRQRQ